MSIRRLVIIAVVATAATAHAGPPPFSHFRPAGLVAAPGGLWLLGFDDCDEGGKRPTADWLGAAPAPASAPRVTLDPAIATLAPALRDRVLAVARSADAVTLYAVGLGGLVVASTDAGQSWREQASHTTNDLHAVWIHSGTDVYAAGARGTLIVLRDGKPWMVDPALAKLAGAATDLSGVWGAGEIDRYVTGAASFASHDGGKTWARMPGSFSAIAGVSADEIYAFAAFDVRISRDRGKTWSRLELAHADRWCLGGSDVPNRGVTPHGQPIGGTGSR